MGKPDRRAWIVAALERYEAPLMRYAHRLLGDAETARDVVQDCFARLCEQRRERLDGHLAEWLFTVCRRRAIDHLRRKGKMHPLEDREPAVEMEDCAARQEQEGTLRALIARLPARQQEVLRLKFQEGLSYRQIGAITSTSAGNVGYLLHHALKTLRGHLAGGRSQ